MEGCTRVICIYLCIATCAVICVVGLVLGIIDINQYNFGLYFALVAIVGLILSVAFCILTPEANQLPHRLQRFGRQQWRQYTMRKIPWKYRCPPAGQRAPDNSPDKDVSSVLRQPIRTSSGTKRSGRQASVSFQADSAIGSVGTESFGACFDQSDLMFIDKSDVRFINQSELRFIDELNSDQYDATIEINHYARPALLENVPNNGIMDAVPNSFLGTAIHYDLPATHRRWKKKHSTASATFRSREYSLNSRQKSRRSKSVFS